MCCFLKIIISPCKIQLLDLKACSGAHWVGNPSIALWWREGMIASFRAVPRPGVKSPEEKPMEPSAP